MKEVVRGYKYSHILCVRGVAFSVQDLSRAVHKELIHAGYGSGDFAHPFHLPPFFRTGSPFADAIEALARRHDIRGAEPPDDMDICVLPHDGTFTPEKDTSAWPAVFGCDFHAEYPNGKYRNTEKATLK